MIREDDDTRKRARGEIARALERAICQAARQPSRVVTVLNETEASLTAVDLASPGDLVVILVDKPGRTWSALQERAKQTVSAKVSRTTILTDRYASANRSPYAPPPVSNTIEIARQ